MVRGGRHELTGRELVQIGGGSVRAEQAGELAADPAQRLAHVQGGADRRRDRGQGFALGQPLGQLGVEPRVILRQPPPLEHPRDDRAETGEIDGLHDVAGAPALDRPDRRVEGRATGDHDDLRRHLSPRGLGQDGGGVDVGELEVDQHEREALPADATQTLAAGRGDGDRVSLALEEIAQVERGFGVGVDDQDGILLAHSMSLSPPSNEQAVLQEHEDEPRQLHADEDRQPPLTSGPHVRPVLEDRAEQRDHGERG